MVSDRMASVGILAAGVAHEINNPLAAVLTNLHMAVECVSTLTVDSAARRIGSSSRKNCATPWRLPSGYATSSATSRSFAHA